MLVYFVKVKNKLFQVAVFVNDIISACQDKNCSYQYSDDETPKITSISPNEGAANLTCQQVTITCEGCLAGIENNEVMIGNAACNITSATQTEIVCCLGNNEFYSHLRYYVDVIDDYHF